MGAFYGSMLVNGVAAHHVIDYLRTAKRNAYVLEVSTSQSVVWDEATQDFSDVEQVYELAAALTRTDTETVIAAINHDDDALGLILCVGGEVIDFYLSRPEMAGMTNELDGDAAVWCDALNVPWLQQQVRALFAARYFVFENERHAALARIFGWPDAVVGVSYEELDTGFIPDGTSDYQLHRIRGA